MQVTEVYGTGLDYNQAATSYMWNYIDSSETMEAY